MNSNAAFGPHWIEWARSMPMTLVGSVLFFGGGGLLEVVGPNLPKHTSHSHLTAGVVVLLVVAIALLLVTVSGAIGVVLSFTAKWWGWPAFVVPPRLRKPGQSTDAYDGRSVDGALGQPSSC